MDSADQQIAIDDSYTNSALTLLRKAVKGNGIRPDNVSVKSFEGAVLQFLSVTQIKLNNSISEKTVPGKTAGSNIFQNRQMAHSAAEEHISNALRNPAVVDQIKSLIVEQPHQGFGLHNKSFKLSFLNQEFVCHEACQPCHGRGRTQCGKCRGEGYELCPQCHAEGFEKCHECNGNRQVRNPQGQMQTCNLCQGLGKISCSLCREHRKIQCKICRTKGEVSCQACGGQGAQSNIVSTEVAAHCGCDFDVGSLPPQAAQTVQNMGVELAKHANVSLVAQQNEEEAQDALHMLYEIHVPQGNVEFLIKNKAISAYLFGTDGEVKDIPNFLDTILAPGAKKLSQAANQQGNIRDNIRDAVRYKTIRQAVTAAARYSSKKAMKALMHYTPLGLSPQMAQTLIRDANTALKNATHRQRTMAIAAGAASALALAAVYFLSPVRSLLLTQLANPSHNVGVDVVSFGLCAALGYVVWHTIFSHARKQALESFMPSKS